MRALLVGINKYEQISSLYGCDNDIQTVKDALIQVAGLREADIVTLLDANATADKIRKGLADLAKNAQPGQRLYFHYSGHGTQLPTTDAEEPDGVDETLCPHDWDWTQSTAITDDDLLTSLAQIPPTTDLIVTLDCCHAGDYSRKIDFTARTPLVPAHIQQALVARHGQRRSLRAAALGANSLVVSACMPFQEAVEINGPNGSAGAFTTHFFGQVSSSPNMSIKDLVTAIVPTLAPLGDTGMTPAVEGTDRLRTDPYVVTRRALRRRGVVRPKSGQQLWGQEWRFNAAGSSGSIAAGVTLLDGTFWLELSVRLFGVNPVIRVPISGDIAETFAIAFGFSLTLGISGVSLDGQTMRFHLKLGIKTPIPFLPPVTVVDTPVSIPLTGVSRGSVQPINNLADLAAFQSLYGTDFGAISDQTVRTAPVVVGPMPRGGAQLNVVLGPADDEAYLTVDGNDVMQTRINEVKQYFARLQDGRHNIRTRLKNSGAWGWRATVRAYINDVQFGSQDQEGGSGFYAGWINEAERSWDVLIENGQVKNL